MVIGATTRLLNTPDVIEKIAKTIHNIHEKETRDNTALKLLVKKREEAFKASRNIIKAIEQGIINDMTKGRMKELEAEIKQYDFDIEMEKQKSYSYLSLEDITAFLKSNVFDSTDDINIRKAIVNTFIREVMLYPDKVIITYKFSDKIENHKITPETINKTEEQITSALSYTDSSCLFYPVPPTKER
ncbi:MAG: hypothetical protein IKB38_10715 [Clostridia bacterium]|nr:hypothetical protein [Clostridia bacterium]MBR2467386.1 hypothetical protein [Clostridia bacterium]